MMNKKFTILLASLLLAVGWTTMASAQALPEAGTKAFTAKFDYSKPSTSEVCIQTKAVAKSESLPYKDKKGSMIMAPRRSNHFNEVASAVHNKAWYEQWYYTYNDGTQDKNAFFTEPATNAYQMMALTSLIYSQPVFPGIKYSKPANQDLEYPRIQFGWGIKGDHYNDIVIKTTASYLNIESIKITDQNGGTVVNWTADDNYYNNTWVNLPTGWTASHNNNTSAQGNTRLRRGTSGVFITSHVYGYLEGGGTITIPSESVSGKGYTELRFEIVARSSRNTNEIHINDIYWSLPSSSWYTMNDGVLYGGVTPPNENGYTVMLVKLKDEVDFESTQATAYTFSETDLYNYFNTYIEEMQLLTDGMRVGQNINGELVDGGTLFSYSGTLNKFFFISKGKMATIGAEEDSYLSDGSRHADRAPFYCMYEEFSPTEQDNTTGIDDFYAKMVNGESYHIKHDCQSVIYQEHFFSMSGKSGTDPKSMSSLLLYIPDYRGTSNEGVTWRDYDVNNQPRVGLYTIRLNAEAAPTPNVDEMYTITVDWTSSLAGIVDNQVSQTYDLFEVIYDENGNITKYEFIATFVDQTTYTTQVQQQDISQTKYYIVKGHPTGATNPDQFYTWSNIDDVTIPGLFDFLMLEKDHVESDFDVTGQKNYYRNYLYPTNLAPNTGMTIEQLKQEWPEDQIAKYTLYRNNKGIAVLEVRAVGKKVYYRIKYYRDTQETDGLNVIPGLDIQYVD